MTHVDPHKHTQNEEPATALNEEEKDKWKAEGKSELDKKYFGNSLQHIRNTRLCR
jgi:hypothetical protein